MKGGSSGSIVYFSNLTLQLVSTAENTSDLQIDILSNNGTSTISMPLNSQDVDTAKAVISYIEEMKNSEQNEPQETAPDNWEPVVGSIRKFPICGKELEVSESMDIFNSYRLKFRELASACADNARKEYDKKVQNLSTFLGFYPKIYQSYLSILIKQSMNILISEGIWTVTEDSFEQQHLADFHLGMNDYTTTLESIELTLQANRRRMSNITSLIPNLSGGGFGLKGAAKGIATATAFNIVRDGAEAGLINSVSNINQAQQAELYGRIKPDYLFECVFTDYWRVFLSLVFLLNKMENPSGGSQTKQLNRQIIYFRICQIRIFRRISCLMYFWIFLKQIHTMRNITNLWYLALVKMKKQQPLRTTLVIPILIIQGLYKTNISFRL